MQRDHLLATRRGTNHTDKPVKQQEEPLGRQSFGEDHRSFRVSPWRRPIEDLAYLLPRQAGERRQARHEAFVELRQGGVPICKAAHRRFAHSGSHRNRQHEPSLPWCCRRGQRKLRRGRTDQPAIGLGARTHKWDPSPRWVLIHPFERRSYVRSATINPGGRTILRAPVAATAGPDPRYGGPRSRPRQCGTDLHRGDPSHAGALRAHRREDEAHRDPKDAGCLAGRWL